MSDKVIKVAGKDPKGNVKGIKVSNFGDISTISGGVIAEFGTTTIDAGKTSGFIFVKTNNPFRVFVDVAQGSIDVPYEVQVHDIRITDDTASSQNTLSLGFTKTCILSDGGLDLIEGFGTRIRSHGGLVKNMGNEAVIIIRNKSTTSPITLTYAVMTYPDSTNEICIDRATPVNQTVSIVEGDTEKKVLFSSSSYTRIEYLEFSSNNVVDPMITISPRNSLGGFTSPLGLSGVDSASGQAVTIKSLDEQKCSMYDKVVEKSTGVKYAINRYMTFPHGLEISIRATRECKFNIRGYFVVRSIE